MEPEMIPAGWRRVALGQGEGHLSRLVTEHLPQGDARVHRLCVVCLTHEGEARVAPFDGERPYTLYHDRPLHLFIGTPPRLYEEA